MKNASLVTEVEELNRKVREILEQVREKDRQINRLQGNYSKARVTPVRLAQRLTRADSCKRDTCSAVQLLQWQMQSTRKYNRMRINLLCFRLRATRGTIRESVLENHLRKPAYADALAVPAGAISSDSYTKCQISSTSCFRSRFCAKERSRTVFAPVSEPNTP